MKFTVDGKNLAKDKMRKGNTTLDVKNDKATFSSVVQERVMNEKDLIRIAGIDTDEWVIERWVCNKWEVASKIGDTDVRVQDLWQVKAWLKRNIEAINLNTIRDAIIGEMRRHAPKYKKISYKAGREPSLLVIDIPDLHFDKLAWGKETGDDWDISLSSQTYMNKIHDLIAKSSQYNIERILFPIGNDFFNADNLQNTTTGGTPQQVDSRWKKSFIAGKKMLINAIDTLQLIAPVDVLVVQGNHDKQRSFYLGDTIESWYHNCPNVTVNNTPPARKYYRYGSTLLGYSHGKDEKVDRLPMILANEARAEFSETKYHEWHLGDKHHKKDIKFMPTQECDGIIIRFLSSLSPADIWHYEHGYMAKRAAQGFIYDKDNGWICQFNSYA